MNKNILIICVLVLILLPSIGVCRPFAAGQTDVGVVRDHNEDSFMIFDEAQVYVVADGMGGHAAGEVASAMAVETVKDYVGSSMFGKFDAVLPLMRTMNIVAAYHEGNRRILAESLSNESRRGMGTTEVSLVVRDGYADVINVGDSRAYLIRDGRMVQVSHDHSLVQHLIDTGELKTQAEIDAFPYKNIITQAMGTRPEIEPDVFSREIREGDIYVLCSDGLTNEVDEEEIVRIILGHGEDLEGSARELVEKARLYGGRDNITVVLVRL